MRKIGEFLKLPVNEARLECVSSHSEGEEYSHCLGLFDFYMLLSYLGLFHRNHTGETVATKDPFSQEQKQKINEIISKMNKVLMKLGKETIKPEIESHDD